MGGSKFCNGVATTVMSDGWCSLPERLGLLGMLSVNKKNALRPLRPDPMIYRGVETWVIFREVWTTAMLSVTKNNDAVL